METIKCNKCAFESDLSFRYCPRCGESLFQPLDLANPSAEDFIPLLNSLYNLLAVPRGQTPHPDRRKYLPELSEKVMARRSRIEHEEDRRHLQWSTTTRPVADLLSGEETMMELYTLSLSNALAGYAYRSIEEMVCRRRSPRIPEAKQRFLLQSMCEESGSDLTESEYKVLSADDVVDRRLLFCLAVRWKNRHQEYMLADDEIQRCWWAAVFSQNLELSEACYKRVLTQLGLMKRRSSLSHESQETVRGVVEQDLIHGYIVKLSESLDPP